jgi:hypothetical protein
LSQNDPPQTWLAPAAIGANQLSAIAADFAKLIWQQASPKWDFDDATFDRSAVAFDNPDHVAIVVHNCRWRLASPKANQNTTISKSVLPRLRRSRYRRSPWKATPTARRN